MATEGGQQFPLDGLVMEQGQVAITWTVALGPDVDAGAKCTIGSPDSERATASCTDDGHFVFTLTADDGVNPPVSDSMTATLTNVPPDMLIMQPDLGQPYPYDAQVVFEAHVYDFGLNDPLTCTVAWGDGATSLAAVVGESCTASHHLRAPVARLSSRRPGRRPSLTSWPACIARASNGKMTRFSSTVLVAPVEDAPGRAPRLELGHRLDQAVDVHGRHAVGVEALDRGDPDLLQEALLVLVLAQLPQQPEQQGLVVRRPLAVAAKRAKRVRA